MRRPRPDAIEAIAAGGAGLAAFVLGSPEAAFAVPVTAPFAVYGVRIAWDKTARVFRMRKAAEARSGIGGDEFTARAMASERSRFLTTEAIRAAEGTYWPESAVAIGRALADSAFDVGDAPVDLPAAVLRTMGQLSESDVRVLSLIATRLYTRSYTEPHQATTEPTEHSEQVPRWAAPELAGVYPAVSDLVPGILAHLDALGLVAERDRTAKLIAGYSGKMTQETNRINPPPGQRATAHKTPSALGESQVERLMPERTWSATKLGRELIGYYELASQTADSAPSAG
jgi:hypothetical protein